MTYDEFIKKVAETAESVGDTVGKAANSAVKKGGEIAETTKLRVQKYNAEQNRDELLRRLGEMIYAARRGTGLAEDSLEALYTELDKVDAEISELTEKIQKMKNTKVCKNCGRSVAKDYGFCPSCGEKFS